MSKFEIPANLCLFQIRFVNMRFSLITLAMSATLALAAPTPNTRDVSSGGHTLMEHAERGLTSDARLAESEKRGIISDARLAKNEKRGAALFESDDS